MEPDEDGMVWVSETLWVADGHTWLKYPGRMVLVSPDEVEEVKARNAHPPHNSDPDSGVFGSVIEHLLG
jgi:hypothetical protein